jgi:hypothetical protein
MHTDFICYTIENYKNVHKLNGKAVIVIFDKFNVISYLEKCYDYLHTTSSENVVWNIDEYISNKN